VGVVTSWHTSRGNYGGGSTGPGSDGILRIATNLLDVPAEIISLIYRFHRTIGIFFRFFKQILGWRVQGRKLGRGELFDLQALEKRLSDKHQGN
jgi:hypothetical protein